MANALYLLYDMCRLCLDEPGTLDIIDNDKMVQDILMCTGILHISSTDNLPRKICSSCIYKIISAKDLRRYSIKNDLYMKSLLDNNTIHVIARPKIPLMKTRPIKEILSLSTDPEERPSKIDKKKQKDETVKSINTSPLENSESRVKTRQQVKAEKCKISVRNLAEINKSVLSSNSSQKDGTSHKKKISASSRYPPEDRTTASNAIHKCDISSEKQTTLPAKKSKRSVSYENKISGDIDGHKCDVCKKTYPTPKKLYLHRRSHTKTIYCPLDACGKHFATKGDLQKHIRSHTGERPYKCDLCDKSFTQNVTLKSHKAAVHVEKM